MCLCWESVQHVDDVRGEMCSRAEFLGESVNLGLRGEVASQEQPEKTFRQRLTTGNRGWKLLLEFRNGEAPEPDTLLRIEQGSLPQHPGDTAHATHGHIHRHLTERLVSVRRLNLLQAFLLTRNGGGQGILDVHASGVPAMRSWIRSGGHQGT